MDSTELMSVLDVVEHHDAVTIAAEERMRRVRRRRREPRSMFIDTPGRRAWTVVDLVDRYPHYIKPMADVFQGVPGGLSQKRRKGKQSQFSVPRPLSARSSEMWPMP